MRKEEGQASAGMGRELQSLQKQCSIALLLLPPLLLLPVPVRACRPVDRRQSEQQQWRQL